MKKKILFLLLQIFAMNVYSLTHEEELRRYKEIVNDPNTPKEERESIKLVIEVIEKQVQKERSLKSKSYSVKKDQKVPGCFWLFYI